MTEPRVCRRAQTNSRETHTHLHTRRAPNRFIRHGVVGNISACHADARGSIPRDGAFRGIGAIGSVRASQARGTGIETQILH